ncbi:single-stranded DNA-binding protein [Candidatus Saganbacteria bacterium]|nr:single-stranded DNA-binding protein [Candidatus Saganbacteria bacterium]
MTGGLNRTILAGRLVADPEIRYTKNETAVTHFRLAINCYGSKDVEFISCVAWGGLAKISGEYLKKGRMIAVEGKLQIRSYKSKTGQPKSATEVVIENLQMLDSKFFNATEKAATEEQPEILPV